MSVLSMDVFCLLLFSLIANRMKLASVAEVSFIWLMTEISRIQTLQMYF